jgi:hypothetical protein
MASREIGGRRAIGRDHRTELVRGSNDLTQSQRSNRFVACLHGFFLHLDQQILCREGAKLTRAAFGASARGACVARETLAPCDTGRRRIRAAKPQKRRGFTASFGAPPARTLLRSMPSKGGNMLWAVAILLVVLWVLGLLTSYTMGGFIHILLVLAVIAVLVNVIQGHRVT